MATTATYQAYEAFVPPATDGTNPSRFDPTQIDSSAQYPIGTIIYAHNNTLSTACAFRYARGVASVAAGDACVLPIADEAAVRLTLSITGGLVGFAMAAVVADKYGWFQVGGRATANVAASFAADKFVFATATAGTVDDAAGATKVQLIGARSESAIDTPATDQAYVDIWFPSIIVDTVT